MWERLPDASSTSQLLPPSSSPVRVKVTELSPRSRRSLGSFGALPWSRMLPARVQLSPTEAPTRATRPVGKQGIISRPWLAAEVTGTSVDGSIVDGSSACGDSDAGPASVGAGASPAAHARPTTISVATPSPSARPVILLISFPFCRVMYLTGLVYIDGDSPRKVPRVVAVPTSAGHFLPWIRSRYPPPVHSLLAKSSASSVSLSRESSGPLPSDCIVCIDTTLSPLVNTSMLPIPSAFTSAW